MSEPDIAALVQEHQKIKAHLAEESKKFTEYLAPYKARQDDIETKIHDFLNQTKQESAKTEFGTAYKSVLTQPKIVERDKYLDFCLDNWDTVGNEMLQLGAPQIATFQKWIEDNKGNPPPGCTVSYWERVNIRKS